VENLTVTIGFDSYEELEKEITKRIRKMSDEKKTKTSHAARDATKASARHEATTRPNHCNSGNQIQSGPENRGKPAMMPEIVLIPGFPDYGATRDGRIFSKKRGQWRELRLHSKGKGGNYLKVKLYDSHGGYEQIAVHKLIASTFIGPEPEPQGADRPDRIVVNHKDFQTTKNEVSNLEWLTEKENIAHAVAGGRIGKPYLSEEERAESKRRTNLRGRIIAKAPSRVAERIAKRKPMRRGIEFSNHKLKEDDVRTIRSLWPSRSLRALARTFGISVHTAHRIVRGKKWRHVV
jgi:hypothetical protein